MEHDWNFYENSTRRIKGEFLKGAGEGGLEYVCVVCDNKEVRENLASHLRFAFGGKVPVSVVDKDKSPNKKTLYVLVEGKEIKMNSLRAA